MCQSYVIDHSCVGLFLGSVLFHCSIGLFLCQYHAVLITVALYCLKSGKVMPPAFFFFLRIALAVKSFTYLVRFIPKYFNFLAQF